MGRAQEHGGAGLLARRSDLRLMSAAIRIRWSPAYEDRSESIIVITYNAHTSGLVVLFPKSRFGQGKPSHDGTAYEHNHKGGQGEKPMDT